MPVAIDGMVIEPGDLILGDADGVLSVPYDDADAVLAAARAKVDAEQKTLQDIAAGRSTRAGSRPRCARIGCRVAPP